MPPAEATHPHVLQACSWRCRSSTPTPSSRPSPPPAPSHSPRPHTVRPTPPAGPQHGGPSLWPFIAGCLGPAALWLRDGLTKDTHAPDGLSARRPRRAMSRHVRPAGAHHATQRGLPLGPAQPRHLHRRPRRGGRRLQLQRRRRPLRCSAPRPPSGAAAPPLSAGGADEVHHEREVAAIPRQMTRSRALHSD